MRLLCLYFEAVLLSMLRQLNDFVDASKGISFHSLEKVIQSFNDYYD